MALSAVQLNPLKIDFGLFQAKNTTCSKYFTSNIEKCASVERIIEALRYYQTLNVYDDKTDKDKLVEFCTNTYKSLTNDYIHTINKHNDILENIYNHIIEDYNFEPCNIQNCVLCSRHYRDRSNNTNNDQNGNQYQFEFYRDLFDSIHCYLLHSFDIGLRIKQKEKNKIVDNNDNIDDCFDAEFANFKKIINEKRNKLQFRRFESHKFDINDQNDEKLTNDNSNNSQNVEPKLTRLESRKFDMIQSPQDHKQSKLSMNTAEPTFMDGLMVDMSNTNISQNRLQLFNQFLMDEEYDTDSALQDMEHDHMISNIGAYLKSAMYYQSAKRYIYDVQIRKTSFNIGYIFYYWDYYKVAREKEQFYKNKNDHSGYTPQELYIPLKYHTLKEEILNNKIKTLNIEQYTICTTKADEYFVTDIVKETEILNEIEKNLHYGLPANATLSYQHLLSLILYCDWTDLSAAFSSTFRKTKQFESITSIKTRNREMSNWSKYLRETVQCFGSFGWNYKATDEYNQWANHVKGPFFCGMSFVMAIPEYNIRLCGPTSTSKQFTVATRFGGNTGIIIQLNNNGYFRSGSIRCFKCGWISNYTEEDEYLFIGGDQRIKIESIRDVATSSNFGIFIKPLYYFDCMMNGTDMDTDMIPDIQDEDHFILKSLIQHKLKINGFKNGFVKYINETFEAFCNHKTQIIINLRFMDLFFRKLSDLILYSVSKWTDSVNLMKKLKNKANKNTDNLFKEQILLKLFKNVNHIIFYTTNINGQKKFIIDLLSLLSLLHSSSVFIRRDLKITIYATDQYEAMDGVWIYRDVSWLGAVWKKSAKSIKSQFTKCGWNIHLTQTTDGSSYNLKQDCVEIQRKFY